jgi:hypothetical protein
MESNLDIALHFFDAMGEDSELYLQLEHLYETPEVKRYIINKLGVPSKSLYQSLWYGSKKIVILSIRDQESVADKPYVFFIPYGYWGASHPPQDTGRDRLRDCFTMWEDCGHQLSDIYNLLLREGCNTPGAMGLINSYLKVREGRL